MTADEVILSRWAAGEISREIALAQLLLTGSVPDVAALPEPIAQLARAHAERLEPLAALARQGFDASSAAATATLFDRLALTAPEAGVAFYTLGDPELMAAATQELVSVIRSWEPVAGRDVLDFGCGTGRVALALAPEARSIVGVDVSPAMVTEARFRATAFGTVQFRVSDGRTLPCDDASCDLALAVDCMPFLVQAGGDALDHQIGEFARVLRPGGALLVFNWSYRGDPERDVRDAHDLAGRHGFAVVAAGEAPFAIWDGRGFHLRHL
ncbi:MAG: class I SAM-dependent methyltransferase [Janthinobacterium lividum]